MIGAVPLMFSLSNAHPAFLGFPAYECSAFKVCVCVAMDACCDDDAALLDNYAKHPLWSCEVFTLTFGAVEFCSGRIFPFDCDRMTIFLGPKGHRVSQHAIPDRALQCERKKVQCHNLKRQSQSL
jgi:hypothetical protein